VTSSTVHTTLLIAGAVSVFVGIPAAARLGQRTRVPTLI